MRHSAFPACSTLLLMVIVAGCQSGGRPPAAAPQAARPPAAPKPNAPPPARLEMAADGWQPSSRAPVAATTAAPAAHSGNRQNPAVQGPASATKPQELIIRATAPSNDNPPDRPPDGHRQPPQGSVRQAAGDRVRELYDQSAAKYAGIRDYICRFRRREVMNGKESPEDLCICRFRKEPFSVHFKSLEGTPCEGRELVYVQGQFNNRLQVKTGKCDLISGLRLELEKDSPRAAASSRRSIDEAGIGKMIERFGMVLQAQRDGVKTYGTLQYLGPQQRPESPVPFECVVQQLPPGYEKYLPAGGQRYWYFNQDPKVPEANLPTLIVTLDEAKRQVEYYCFDRFNMNVGLKNEDFDPNILWAKK